MRLRALTSVLVAAVGITLGACSSGSNDTGNRVDQALKQANVKNVDVDWDKNANVVHLKGKVDSPDDRAKAEQVATDVVGTSGKVMNELTVTGMDDKTADNADGLIKSRLNDSIKADSQLSDQTIDLNVNNGMVTLTGEVQTVAQKEKAGEMAKATPGVRDVANEISVKTPAQKHKGTTRR
jgi:hyperosmotically inducible periplasmic protein